MNVHWARRLLFCVKRRTEAPQLVSKDGILWSHGCNAVEGSRQLSRVPLEDAMAPLFALWGRL